MSCMNNYLYHTINRPNSFQVRSRDGMSKVNLHCDDDTPDQLNDWTTAISERIIELNRSEVCIYILKLNVYKSEALRL